MRRFIFFFHTKSLKPGVYFTVIAHLNSDVKQELGILDLNLDFIKFTVKKDIGTPKLSQRYLSFPITESSISFKFKLPKIKQKLKIQFFCPMSHISNVRWPQEACGYSSGQPSSRLTFPP